MMIRKKFLLFFIIIGLAMGAKVHSQNKLPSNNYNSVVGKTTEEILLKTQIEKNIAESLKQIISTQLPAESFQVSVSLDLLSTPASSPNKPSENQNKNRGEEEQDLKSLDFSSIDVEKIILSYEKEIAEIKEKYRHFESNKESQEAEKITYKIRNLKIFVGLDKSYPDSYAADFQSWLQKTVLATYGPKAQWSMGRIHKIDPSPITTYEMAKDLKELLGLGAIAMALLFGFLILSLLSFKSLKIVTKNQLDTKNIIQHGRAELNHIIPPLQLSSFNEKNAHENTSASLIHKENELRHTQESKFIQKIIGLLEQIDTDELSKLIKFWIKEGQEGSRKIYLLLDAIVTVFSELKNFSENSTINIKSVIDLSLMQEMESESINEHLNLKELLPEERLRIFNEIYWELIGLFSLGSKHLKKPFDFLVDLKSEQRKPLIEAQNSSEKMITILCSPKSVQQDFVNHLSLDQKTEIIKEAYKTKNLSSKIMNDIETALQIRTIHTKNKSDTSNIDLFPKTVDLLQNMNLTDEIKILFTMSKDLADKGLALSLNHFSFAFLNYWHSKFSKKLIEIAQIEELLAILSIIPSFESLILKYSPERTKAILKDELKNKKNIKDTDNNTHLMNLKKKFMLYLNNEKINSLELINVSDDDLKRFKNAG